MSRLTRDGTAEPVSLDQILRRERGQGKDYFPCYIQLTLSRIGSLTGSILTLAICDDHTYYSLGVLGRVNFIAAGQHHAEDGVIRVYLGGGGGYRHRVPGYCR